MQYPPSSHGSSSGLTNLSAAEFTELHGRTACRLNYIPTRLPVAQEFKARKHILDGPGSTHPGMGTGFQMVRHLSRGADSSAQTSSYSRGILSSGWLLSVSASCVHVTAPVWQLLRPSAGMQGQSLKSGVERDTSQRVSSRHRTPRQCALQPALYLDDCCLVRRVEAPRNAVACAARQRHRVCTLGCILQSRQALHLLSAESAVDEFGSIKCFGAGMAACSQWPHQGRSSRGAGPGAKCRCPRGWAT